MMSQLESLANEIFLHEIFPYLKMEDLLWTCYSLNSRFNQLSQQFVKEKVQDLHLSTSLSLNQANFIIDHIQELKCDFRLRSMKICHTNIFSKFLNKVQHFNVEHLNRIDISIYEDINFPSTMRLISSLVNLSVCYLKVLTNFDKKWANGRQWLYWFDRMMKSGQSRTLTIFHVHVWCIATNDAVHFDPRYWETDGTFIENRSWKVQLEPNETMFFKQEAMRRSVPLNLINPRACKDKIDCTPS